MVLTRRTVTSLFLVLLLVGAAAPLSQGNSSGNTGASCSCHGAAGSSVTITLEGLVSDMWSPSTTYRLFVNASSSIGVSKGGFSLAVDAGSLSGVSGSSQIQSGKATHVNSNSRSWQIDWTSPSSGSSVTFSVTANTVDGTGQTNGDRWQATTFTRDQAPNSPPSVSDVIISPSLPTATTPLTVTYAYSDPESNLESGTQIRWTLNGSSVGSLDNQASVTVDALEKGQTWVVKVTPSDGVDLGVEVTSDPVTILNTLPTVTSLDVSPINPEDDDNLTVSFTLFDADDKSGVTYPQMPAEISWRLGGVLKSEWKNQSIVPFTATRAGDQWEVTVTPYDRDGDGVGTSSSAIITVNSSNTRPVISNLTITPDSPSTLDDLQATWTFFDEDMDSPDQCSLEWFRDVLREPAYDNLETLPSSATVKSQSWNVRVSCSDGELFSETATSSNVIISDTAPTIVTASLSPNTPTSSEDVTLAWEGEDADNDPVSGVSVQWFKDGQEVASLANLTTISSSETNRGEVWSASVQGQAAGVTGNATVTSGVTILNSLPSVSNLGIGPLQPTAASDLALEFSTTDADDDVVTVTSIRWIRDGFEVSELAGEQSVPSRLLAPDQTWMVYLSLSDGIATTSEFSSAEVTIGNILPVAIIIAPNDSRAGLLIELDGSNSTDNDGRITAYFWTIGDEPSTGSTTSATLSAGTYEISLTVVDDAGGRDSVVTTLVVGSSPMITNLKAVVEDGRVVLSWTPADGYPDVEIYRTSKGGVIDGIDAIGLSNGSSWSEPIHTIGEHTYVVVVIVNGQSVGAGASADVEITQAHSTASLAAETIEDDNGLQWLMYVIAILVLIAIIMIIMMPRMRQLDSHPATGSEQSPNIVPSWEHLPVGGAYDQSGSVLRYVTSDGLQWQQQSDGTWQRL